MSKLNEIEQNYMDKMTAKKRKLADIECLVCKIPECKYLGEIIDVTSFTIKYKAYCCRHLPEEYIKKPIEDWVCCECVKTLYTQADQDRSCV